MTTRRTRRLLVAALACAAVVPAAAPAAASAFDPIGALCTVAGVVNNFAGKACSVANSALGGGGGGAGAVASKAGTALALAAVLAWVTGGAKFALLETAHVLGRTNTPQLGSLWFSTVYWRVAAISALLTLPFLFIAAAQAILSSDLPLLMRAALGYLPLAALLVAVAAPLTTLLLSASDEMSGIVSGAAGGASAHFFSDAAGAIGGISLAVRSPFLVFFAGLLTVGAAVLLWLELLMRGAAVYVIVLMLPLAFAAMVWPARRVWAVRAVELLIALILSKFAIVAVLSLGGAALGASEFHSVTGLFAGVSLLALSICAPWAMLRLLPMAEVATGAAASLRDGALSQSARLDGIQQRAADWAPATTAYMSQSSRAERGDPAPPEPWPSPTPAAALNGSSPPAGSPPPHGPSSPDGPSPAGWPTDTALETPSRPRPWEAPNGSLHLVLGPDPGWRDPSEGDPA
jgi:hypothetical protein